MSLMSGDHMAELVQEGNPPQIESYRFGEVVIDGRRYRTDVIIFPDHVEANWWREEGHSVAPVDVWEVLRDRPDVLVVGLGAHGRVVVLPQTRRQLDEAGVQLIALPTEQACQTYNRLSRQRTVVAALHLTC